MIIALSFAFSIAILQLAWAANETLGETAGVVSTILHLAMALMVYMFHGRGQVTPLGIFALASAAFLALPYLYGLAGITFDIEPIHNLSAAICLYAFCGSALISMWVAPSKVYNKLRLIDQRIFSSSNEISTKWLFFSLLLLSIGWISLLGSDLASRFSEPSLFLAFVLALFFLISGLFTKQWMISIFSSLIGLAVLASYLQVAFSGFGRLRIASLGFAALLLWSALFRSYLIKVAPIAVAPFFLVWGGMVRSSSSEFDFRVLIEAQGLGSLLAPFNTLSELLEHFSIMVDKGLADFQYGATYLYNILFWVPRAVWEDKPDGLGRMYVEWLTPELLHTGHSISGSYIGEAFVNFYVWGILIVPVIAGLIIGLISKYSIGLIRNDVQSDMSIIYITLYIILSSSMADFLWADTNTFTHRGMVRAFVLFCVVVLIYGLKVFAPRRKRIVSVPTKRTIRK